jgi:acetylglutamate kinase
MKPKLSVIKIGGNVVDNTPTLHQFLHNLAHYDDPVVLIHGGGKLATQLADKLGIKQTMVEGRRITDEATLDVVTMVYAGLINKKITSKLHSMGRTAVGLSGADGNLIRASKRQHPEIDFGYVGDVQEVNATFLHGIINQNLTPVLCAITHDYQGQLLNTNADTIAQEVAVALSSTYEVSLVYIFEKSGVLMDIQDENSVIAELTNDSYLHYKMEGIIHTGMVPKLDNAFKAIDTGVDNVKIGKAEDINDILHGKKGTKIL